jgi:hypothetical protein
MTVRHDPGLMAILSSLWAGLGGMTLTFIGRIRLDDKRSMRAKSSPEPGAPAPKEIP